MRRYPASLAAKATGGRLRPSDLPCPLEHDEQTALMEWAKRNLGRWPELALLFAIPNGGARSAITGARMRDEGVKPGVPDLFLPVARGRYHGLFIEMKRRRGDGPDDQQTKWHDDLRAQGYRVEVCRGAEPAETVLRYYLCEA